MGTYVGMVASGPSASLTLDLQALTSRIANLLRRNDLNAEIQQWLNFVQRDMAKEIKFKELRSGVEATLQPMPVAPVTTPSDYYYLGLPSDFSTVDHVHYQNTTDANAIQGYGLVPLPRKFYSGDTVDLERLLNTSTPSVGEPIYFWIEGSQIGVYPALEANLTGKIQLWYYRIPPDMTLAVHEPVVPNSLRHYMIYLALYWGKILTAQSAAEMPLVAYWEKKYTTTMMRVKGFEHEVENPIEAYELPNTGFEQADEVY